MYISNVNSTVKCLCHLYLDHCKDNGHIPPARGMGAHMGESTSEAMNPCAQVELVAAEKTLHCGDEVYARSADPWDPTWRTAFVKPVHMHSKYLLEFSGNKDLRPPNVFR